MKIKTLIKGLLGLAIIVLICLPINAMAETVKNVKVELSKNPTEPVVKYPVRSAKKFVSFNEIAHQGLTYGTKNEKYIDMFCCVK